MWKVSSGVFFFFFGSIFLVSLKARTSVNVGKELERDLRREKRA